MDFLILALATFRISNLIADEEGPLGSFDRLRQWLGVERDHLGKQYGTNNFTVGLICVWCNSVWIGIILTPIYLLSPRITIWSLLPFALSTIALILSEITKYLARSNDG